MTDSTFEVIPGSEDVISMELLNAKTSKSTSSGNSEMCENTCQWYGWLPTFSPETSQGMPPNKKWNNFLSCIQVSLILAHFVPVGAGPMKFTKASSNQPLVLVVAKKWCYLQMNVVISNMYKYTAYNEVSI